MKAWWLICLIAVATPRSCAQSQATTQSSGGPTAVVVGQTIRSTIASKTPQCAESIDPCLVYQLTASESGTLTASLTWPDQQEGLRIEMWRDDAADGKCCRSGEQISLPVAKGDRAEVHVVFVRRHGGREPFELTTALHHASG